MPQNTYKNRFLILVKYTFAGFFKTIMAIVLTSKTESTELTSNLKLLIRHWSQWINVYPGTKRWNKKTKNLIKISCQGQPEPTCSVEWNEAIKRIPVSHLNIQLFTLFESAGYAKICVKVNLTDSSGRLKYCTGHFRGELILHFYTFINKHSYIGYFWSRSSLS